MKQATIPLYIRFGNIPKNQKSKIYAGDQVVGEEPGVSVYRAVEVAGIYFPLMEPDFIDDGIMDYFQLLFESVKDEKKKVLVVTGDELRFEGHDREVLLTNVKIIKDYTKVYTHLFDKE